MQRCGSRSPTSATQFIHVPSMSSSTSQSSRSQDAPFGLCPSCRLPILKLKSGTPRNPNRVFYKCPNYQKDPSCRFYMWEDEFETYVHGARDVTVQTPVIPPTDSDLVSRIEDRLDNLTEEVKKNCQRDQSKKRIKDIVASVDNLNRKLSNIELICAALLIVLVSLLVVIIGN